MSTDASMRHNQMPALKIKWIDPDLKLEIGEYWENNFTKAWFKRYGLVFKTKQAVFEFLMHGKLMPLTIAELKRSHENMTLDDKDFEKELKDKDYSKSYKSMEDTLLGKKTITLPAPIVIKFLSKYYGFAGNRRTNLARRHNIPLKVWLISLDKQATIDFMKTKLQGTEYIKNKNVRIP